MSFNVKFIITGNLVVNIPATDEMMFAELAYHFGQKVGLEEDNKVSFIFNSVQIKADSVKILKEIGIVENSVIYVNSSKPLYYQPENKYVCGRKYDVL